jgi:hypothetical protein
MVANVNRIGRFMTKPLPKQSIGTEARARFDKTPGGALMALYRPLKMTATMKRRALKKRPSKPEFVAHPVIEWKATLCLLSHPV